MTNICAWCDPAKVETEAAIARGDEVTHGICPTHFEEQMQALGLSSAIEEETSEGVTVTVQRQALVEA